MPFLIVDDSKAMRMFIRRALRQTGRREDALEAANAQEALSLLEKHEIAAVLSDWNMPGMDGLELVKAIRKSYPRLKVLFVTTEWSPLQQEAALRAGAGGLLPKPFSADDLDKALCRLGL